MDAQERGTFLTHRLTEYQQLWSKFMDMFSAALKKQANEITEEEEMQFRELQAEVIRRTQFLGHRMPPGVFDIAEGVHNLFRQSFSLRCIRAEPSIKITDLRSQWHDISIALNKMHGQLRAALEGTVSHKGKKRH
jgi:hypothetical protein